MVLLNTERLVIRDHVDSDLEAMHELLSDEKAMYFLPEIQTESYEESRENLIAAMRENTLPDRKKYFFAILAYSGTSGRRNRKHPDTIPETSGQ